MYWGACFEPETRYGIRQSSTFASRLMYKLISPSSQRTLSEVRQTRRDAQRGHRGAPGFTYPKSIFSSPFHADFVSSTGDRPSFLREFSPRLRTRLSTTRRTPSTPSGRGVQRERLKRNRIFDSSNVLLSSGQRSRVPWDISRNPFFFCHVEHKQPSPRRGSGGDAGNSSSHIYRVQVRVHY